MSGRYKPYGQKTFLDSQLAGVLDANKPGFLEAVGALIDFEGFRPVLEEVFKPKTLGQCPYDCILLFKVVLLAKWYGLPDPQVEYQVRDRLSFRRFLNLSVNDEVPDETTVCNFRNRLKESGTYEALFNGFNRQLEANRLKVVSGSIIDATFVQAPKGKRSNGEKTDPDADFGHKGHGYSVHANVDKDTKLLNALETTSARPHDSQHFCDVITGEEQDVWADSAYWDDELVECMEAVGMHPHILEKARRNHPLTDEQKAVNKEKSKIRCRGEHPFSELKNKQGFGKTRYVGLPANRCDTFLHGLAYNIKRTLTVLHNKVLAVLISLRHFREKYA